MFVKSGKTLRSPTNQSPTVAYTNNQQRRGSSSETKEAKQKLPEEIISTTSGESPTQASKPKAEEFLPILPIPPFKPTKKEQPNPPFKPTKKEQPNQQEQIEKQATLSKEQPQTIMNQQQIQQNIASSVPEFSGENQGTRTNDLTRFTATADSIYQTLGSEEEKKIFSRLIKLRLTGEAFTRVAHRNIEDYTKLRELLNNMYSRTYSLDELERGYTTIQQSYGETIRNYGYRLLEALEQYRIGYKTKYKLTKIDEAYNNHIETNSVQIFKRGLNNTILKERIATSMAKNVDEIIDETEIIERMLTATTEVTTSHNLTQNPLPKFLPARQQQSNHHQVTCNYCQRPNHTWDICRTRINQERMRRITTQTQPYNTQRHQDQRYQPPVTYHNQARPETYNKQYPTSTQQNQQYNRLTTMNVQPNRNQYPPAQYTQVNRYQPKFCSHCKTTTGHTFDECRSKFFTKNPYQPNTKNNPSTDTRELTDKFNNMRINMMYPQSRQNPATPEQYMHQGNANRSDQ